MTGLGFGLTFAGGAVIGGLTAVGSKYGSDIASWMTDKIEDRINGTDETIIDADFEEQNTEE